VRVARWPMAALAALVAMQAGAQSLRGTEGRRVFLRGVGWSPWHRQYGWHRPPDVVAQDWALVAGLHANAVRTWGPVDAGNAADALAHGINWVPQVPQVREPATQFADGSRAPAPIFASTAAREAFRRSAEEAARAMNGLSGVLALNLGNEYAATAQNARGDYVYHGFDAETQAAFRAWLSRRGAPNADVRPPQGVQRSAVFWEWWLFLRDAFGRFLDAGADGARSGGFRGSPSPTRGSAGTSGTPPRKTPTPAGTTCRGTICTTSGTATGRPRAPASRERSASGGLRC